MSTLPELPVERTEDQPREALNLSGKTLAELMAEAQAIQDKCEDFEVPNANDETVRFSDGLLHFTTPEGIQHRKMSRHAMGQLCTKVGVPANYVQRCVNAGRIDLAEDNVNEWLSDCGKSLLIRGYENQIRGIVSDRFMTLDAPDILSVLAGEVDPDAYEIKGHYLNEERLHARVVQRDLMPVLGEDLFAGIQIDSSDVGRSTLTVSFFIYKLVCTNGMISSRRGGVLFQQVHRGTNVREFRQGFVTAMGQIDSLTTHFADFVNIARKKELPRDSETLRNTVKADFGLSDESTAAVFETLESRGYGSNQWGLLNAVTEVAQRFTLERRIDLERAAGNMLLKAAF